VDPDTFNISMEGIRKAITPKTKAIIPVHLFGQSANMNELLTISREHHIAIVEDVAQAFGAKYKLNQKDEVPAGTMGDIGCTSFFPSKNLGCYGDGGALFTNHDGLAEMIRSIANHGMKVRYFHDHIGINSRLDTIQAAILNVKLKYLDEYNLARQKAADFYDRAFSGCDRLKIPVRDPKSTHIFHQYTLVLKNVNRDELRSRLQSKGIPAMVYYPVPLHSQNAYRYLGYHDGDFPVTEKLCKSVISLPMHTELDTEQLEFITKNLLELF
jgi:UDP-2-acetamido-2-deoxy-ribo-hexuluronate aminotransferase